jgi:tetratricopeptide (TPR) repeat protein
MPPEQALSEPDQVGPHSDVYSLGAMLYHLLTGQAPFTGSSLEETLEKVVRGDLLPARRVKPAVPAALEAVCKKGMAIEPGQRYESARALAEEVERWLADEPVLAYREPLADRLRRWGRRHCALVISAVLLLATGMVGLTLGLWAVHLEKIETVRQRDRAHVNLARARQAEDEAKANLRRAEDNLRLARRAVDDCFGVAKDHPLLQARNMRPVKELLLRKTLPYYRDFRARAPDNLNLAVLQALSLYRVGTITAEIGQRRAARESLFQAVALLDEAARGQVRRQEYRAMLAAVRADVLNQLGLVEHSLGHTEQAVRALERSRDIRRGLVKEHAEPPQQSALADTLTNLGMIHAGTNRRKEALACYREASALRERLVAEHAREESYQLGLAATLNNLGMLEHESGQRLEGRRRWERGRAVMQALIKAHPRIPRYRQVLSLILNNLAASLRDDRPETALAYQQEALDLMTALALANPDDAAYQADRALGMANLVSHQAALGKQEATANTEALCALWRGLVETHPNVQRYRHGYVEALRARADQHQAAGRHEQAAAGYRQALEIAEPLAREQPRTSAYRESVAVVLANLGRLEISRNKATETLPRLEQARDLFASLVKAHPEVTRYRDELALALTQLGRARRQAGKPEAALAEWSGYALTFLVMRILVL